MIAEFKVSGIIFTALGLAILIFRKKIGKIYDSFDLTEKEKSHYKNNVLKVLGIMLTVSGAVFIVLSQFPKENIIQVINTISGNKNVMVTSYLVLGIAAFAFGALTIFIRVTNRSQRYFAKLEIMKRQYGEKFGTIYHVLGYTVVPMVIGLFFFYRALKH